MKQITITELRKQTRCYFDMVEAGETVRVLRNGKPIAEIRPIRSGLPSWKQRAVHPLIVDGIQLSAMILANRDK